MEVKDRHIGFAFTGSFCTIEKVIPEMERLVERGARVTPILSNTANTLDTRFGRVKSLRKTIEEITQSSPLTTIVEVEPIGPENWLDLLIIAPCTGNTLAKLALGITDDTVLMAAKATLRNKKPVVLGIATNDGLGSNAMNLGRLFVTKNIFFVPFGQDDPMKKENSIVSRMTRICHTIEKALIKEQIQPVLIEYNL